MMRPVIAAGVLLLLGCDAESVAAPDPPAYKTDRDVSSLQFTIPLNTVVFVPCANHDQGERVFIVGTQTLNFFVNEGPDRSLQRVRERLDGVGTGEVTGATWQLHQIINDIVHRTAAGDFSEHWTSLALLRGEGSAPDFYVRFMQIIRTDNAGHPHPVIQRDVAICR